MPGGRGALAAVIGPSLGARGAAGPERGVGLPPPHPLRGDPLLRLSWGLRAPKPGTPCDSGSRPERRYPRASGGLDAPRLPRDSRVSRWGALRGCRATETGGGGREAGSCKGPRGRGKGRGGRDFGNKGQLSYVRGKMRGKTINGLIRRVIGRMSLYPDPQGRRGGRGGATFSTILTHEKNDERSFLTSTTRHGLPPPPSPPGPMGFRGRPPHPKARGMLWMPTGRFPPPRGVT
ncbi:translation initiation factor IF-2-like isoform X2 [Dermochelys coriacea]|uniref:translation initiation factor IF-2-like isoform X2 n=1 Tax=Dermochelys coriacea TaxID=27794 RepID=UPI001CA93A65|nr:translation initiation factor IF-2-like isoform X2 [Dermochelys coriacea]